MAGGRPTKYDPAYCDLVVEHCKTGASLTSFAASIDVCRATITVWSEDHAEFLAAVKRAKAHCAAWWEQNARKGMTGESKDVNATLCIFGLKNMAAEDWREKQEVQHSGGVRVERVERTIVDPANPDG